ncbi:nonstructural protein [Capybara microvirus Cap1_SP_162]|nr:nonstructural protein [Capybara microvirus Cap1_SP_162]
MAVYKIYSVQDVLIGFNAPFIMINDDIAKREYRNMLETNPNRADMRLFRLASFDDETGMVTPEITPVLVEGGANGSNKDSV